MQISTIENFHSYKYEVTFYFKKLARRREFFESSENFGAAEKKTHCGRDILILAQFPRI